MDTLGTHIELGKEDLKPFLRDLGVVEKGKTGDRQIEDIISEAIRMDYDNINYIEFLEVLLRVAISYGLQEKELVNVLSKLNALVDIVQNKCAAGELGMEFIGIEEVISNKMVQDKEKYSYQLKLLLPQEEKRMVLEEADSPDDESDQEEDDFM